DRASSALVIQIANFLASSGCLLSAVTAVALPPITPPDSPAPTPPLQRGSGTTPQSPLVSGARLAISGGAQTALMNPRSEPSAMAAPHSGDQVCMVETASSTTSRSQ